MDGPRGCARRSPGVHLTTEPWPAASAVGARAGAGAATTAPSPLRPARRPAEAPRGARAAPPAAWLAARLRPRVARPQPQVGTHRPPSVCPSSPAERPRPCSPLRVPQTQGGAEPSGEAAGRVLIRGHCAAPPASARGSPIAKAAGGTREAQLESRPPWGGARDRHHLLLSAARPPATAGPRERPGGCGWRTGGTGPRPPGPHG